MMFTKRYLVFSHGKRARRKSPKADFSPKFANRAKTARFALSHSRDDDGYSVTFPMSRRSSPGLHSQMAWHGPLVSCPYSKGPHWQGAQGGGDSLLPARQQKDEELF